MLKCTLNVVVLLLLTHEAATQREVVHITESVDGGQSVEHLLQDEQTILQVCVLFQPLGE